MTPKQSAFCAEYLIDLNATGAARRAGYSVRSSAFIGWDNLRKPAIAARIAELQRERAARVEITADQVLDEYAKVAFSDIREVLAVREGGCVEIFESGQWTDAQAAAVSEVRSKPDGTLSLKLHSKLEALAKLAQHLGLLVERIETGQPGAFDAMSDEELDKRAGSWPRGWASRGVTATSVRLELLQALDEIQVRRARHSLLAYVGATYPAYQAAHFHVSIATALERVTRGECPRLMIITPPRHGKSLLASRRFPAWYLGRHPDREVIHAGYGGELVNGFGRSVRNVVQDPWHRRVFPDSAMSADSGARDMWHTESGGVYRAAGVGGAITGFGAHLLLIDDPVKGREEADSERMQELTWDWYTNDAYTRLMKGASIVLIQTRWHELDLAGRLLEAQKHGGDQWEVIHFPAINAQGDALWPEMFPVPTLEQIRRVVMERVWNSLYQGDPTPESGTYFKREWLRYAPRPPMERMRIYAASDYATRHDAGDWTVHVVVGITPSDDIHILQIWRERTTSDVWVEALLALVHGTPL